MTNPTPNPPLWKAMETAYFSVSTSESHRYAAELRAIAKEASLLYEDNDPAVSLIAWLEAEADRAEAEE